MYTAASTKKLDEAGKRLLKHPEKLGLADLDQLREVIRFHEYRYSILNDPLISDFEYDQLYKALQRIEGAHPDRVTPDSPTQRVSSELTASFPKVKHLVPMLSLDNSYNPDDLADWDKRNTETIRKKPIEYCIEPKFDGAGISLIYENDLLRRGATRGDGEEGDDITVNIRQILTVPLSAKFSEYGIKTIEIRGEVLLTKENFKKYNQQLLEQQLPPLANPRNAAAGSLRIKDPAEVKRRNLEAFLYHVSYVEALPGKKLHASLGTHGGNLQMLWDLGFRSPEREKRILKGIDDVIAYCGEFESKRDDLPYEIDGMVIKVNDLGLQDQLGRTSHHPRWAMAFKFKARQATSKLVAVEFQVGRTGSVTPVAKIEPVPIGGVTVTSISLFNEEVIKEKDLKIGDTVLVERAGDVIPYIVKSMAELRKGHEKAIHFPRNCPVCGDKLVKPVDEAVWRCVNINCEAQVLQRIEHFTSKDAMDIRGFGEAMVHKFHELGFLKDIPGVYHLPFDKIRQLEGFGEKSVTNLQNAIEKSKQQPLNRLIFGLGIRYVGEATAKTLAQAVSSIFDYKSWSEADLAELEDVGPKVAGSIFQFFKNPDNIHMLQTLEKLGLNLKNTGSGQPVDGNLGGQTFLFTGTLPTLKRSEAEALVEKHGGRLLGGVSSKLNVLVVGEDAGSKLEKARKIGTIKILSEEEFLAMVNAK